MLKVPAVRNPVVADRAGLEPADFEAGYRLSPGDDAVNAGLRAIGVQAIDGRDEYATVGLDRHRMSEDWLR